MGKIVAWLVLIFIVLLALRMVNSRKTRRQQGGAAPDATTAEPMVRCVRCGVFLPRAEATRRGGEYACPDGQCAKR